MAGMGNRQSRRLLFCFRGLVPTCISHACGAASRGILLIGMALMVSQVVDAQETKADGAGIKNGGFEEMLPNGRPRGWLFPDMLAKAGYKFAIESEGAFVGKNCARLDAPKEPAQGMFGNLMQSIDAAPFRGRQVRFRAAVRAGNLEIQSRAQLWFRVDRKGGAAGNRMGAFDNMDNRPIRDHAWKHYDIVAQVDDDAERIHVGLLLIGAGTAWIDDVSLEIVAKGVASTTMSSGKASDDPPQPFFVGWLALAAVAIALFVLAHGRTSTIQRLALRFSAVYWLLYYFPQPISNLTPAIGIQLTTIYMRGVDLAVRWTAARVLHIDRSLVAPNGSGDTTFDYIRILIIFALAMGVAVLWSLIDRRKVELDWLADLLRSYLRYVLAFIMLGYGLAKVVASTNQFPPPSVDQLFKGYGESSPMNLAWTFMGSSQAYTAFAGLSEILAALLLVWRRTYILGAMVAMGVMLNIVMMNFCYDIPVKQFSSHLLMSAAFLALYDARRLSAAFLFNRAVSEASLRPPYAAGWTIWLVRALQCWAIVVGIALPIFHTLRQDATGSAVNDPPVFGAFEVESFKRGNQEVPPLLSDATRWRRVSINRYRYGGPGQRNDVFAIRMMNNSTSYARPKVSDDGMTLTFEAEVGGSSLRQLTCQFPDETHMILTGGVGTDRLVVKMRRLKREDFPLVNRGFRWINEYPFNR